MITREERKLLSKAYPIVDMDMLRWPIFLITTLIVVFMVFSFIWDLIPLFTQVVTVLSVVLLSSSFIFEFLRNLILRRKFRRSVLAVGKYSEDVFIIYREDSDLDMLGVAKLLAKHPLLVEDIIIKLQSKDNNLLLNRRALSPYMVVTFKKEGTVYNRYSMVQKRVKSIQRKKFIDVESQHDLLTIVQLVKHGLCHRIISRAYPYWSEKQHHTLIAESQADRDCMDPDSLTVG